MEQNINMGGGGGWETLNITSFFLKCVVALFSVLFTYLYIAAYLLIIDYRLLMVFLLCYHFVCKLFYFTLSMFYLNINI